MWPFTCVNERLHLRQLRRCATWVALSATWGSGWLRLPHRFPRNVSRNSMPRRLMPSAILWNASYTGGLASISCRMYARISSVLGPLIAVVRASPPTGPLARWVARTVPLRSASSGAASLFVASWHPMCVPLPRRLGHASCAAPTCPLIVPVAAASSSTTWWPVLFLRSGSCLSWSPIPGVRAPCRLLPDIRYTNLPYPHWSSSPSPIGRRVHPLSCCTYRTRRNARLHPLFRLATACGLPIIGVRFCLSNRV